METQPGVPDLREERKVVTALFADLAGSTALAERLDPEEIRLVVGEAVARIVHEVEELGGHVKDLAGDGVLAFFGAPVSYEDDAERAVRAGLRITNEIGRYAEEVESAWRVSGFGVRVGVGTGPVVLGKIGAGSRLEYAAFGDTVNVAARLQSAAVPGTVLVDRPTQRAIDGLFECEEPVELELKGKAEPVAAVAVLRPRAIAERRRGLEGAESALVGRDPELRAGGEWLERVRNGTGGVLFVTGEAGIGKSRLLVELRHRFESRPVEEAHPLWLEGRCVSYSESLPLWPFRDLLREWLGVAVDEPELRVRVVLRRRAEELFPGRTLELYPYLGSLLGLTLEPEAAARLAELSPEALQYRTFEVVGTLLERLAQDGPLVVAVEDLHWADATSVQLVERLLPLTEDAAVLLVLAERDERDHPSWGLSELTAREYPHLLRELALEPLSGDAERELLDSLVGAATLPSAMERELLERAEGNPFFLEECVRSLADAGALVREDGAWRFDHAVEAEIPQTVEKVILARIDRLAAAHHDVLTAASALGRSFSLALLEGVAGDDRVREALHQLQRLDLLRTGRRWPQPEYRFKHALIQETAYRTLVRETRTALHRRAAEWLERRHADNLDEAVGLLAHHWLAAEDEAKAVAYLTRAADRARQEYSLDEAIDLYRELLQLLERRGERQAMAIVLFKLALALHTSLRFREANTTFGRAFDLWERPRPSARPTATLRIAGDVLAAEPDPPRSYGLSDMQLQMALLDRLVERWPEATIVPSLAERWEISDDGLRYVFHLLEGVSWSDGTPLTAHDVEYGVKRSLDPKRPGVSVAIYYVLENGQDYALGRNRETDRIGVRALDDRTVEFRLVAPAPYFLSVVNRPDGGPQPAHAIEAYGDDWTDVDTHVGSGAFRQVERSGGRVVLERRTDASRSGNVARVELIHAPADEALERFRRDEVDVVSVQAASSLASIVGEVDDHAELGPPAYTFYVVFDHRDAILGNVSLRRALAHALDRSALAGVLPPSLDVATGGIVPPALQGHTPDIAPRFDPELARSLLAEAAQPGPLRVVTTARSVMRPALSLVTDSWREHLGVDVTLRVLDKEEFARARMYLIDFEHIAPSGWFPGYPDPEYFLRLLLHSDAKDNLGHWNHSPFDDLIERARREPDGRARLELFHEADRMAIADQVAVIPLAYARNVFFVKPWVRGWWEFGKSWSSFADLVVTEDSPRLAR
ncbi:MAG: ABC transporter substrate-binding protein [Gaiellaceae bacterium]